MRAVCTDILLFQPGNLKKVSTTDTESNPIITTQKLELLFHDPITNLVAVTPMPPAATELFPQGTEPNTMGHYPHGSIPAPYTGNKNEDPASLTAGPPQGSTTRQPASLQTLAEPNESSSVNHNDKDTIQWGAYQPTLTPVGSWGNPNYQPPSYPQYFSGTCSISICNKLMGTLNPLKTLTCHECIQWVKQGQATIQDNDRPVRHVTTNKDDEEEFLFQGIPIAGENKGDSEDSWESEIFGYDATDHR
jgi:hypothetical protein